MSLLQCPYCGKMVSDTAENCIHCGNELVFTKTDEEDFIPQAKQQKDYAELSIGDKVELQREFYNSFPKYKNYENVENKIKKVSRVSTICIIIGIVLALPMIFMQEDASMFFLALGIIGLILFSVSDVVDIICPFLARKYKKKSLISLKKYQKWLKENKGIDYKVLFNANEKKWKKYFDEINVDMEDI